MDADTEESATSEEETDAKTEGETEGDETAPSSEKWVAVKPASSTTTEATPAAPATDADAA